MTNTVYKYPCPFADYFIVNMPVGARILAFHNQNEGAYLWALVDIKEKETEERKFRMAGTGHPIREPMDTHYIGTALFQEGALVFHLFEVPVK